MRTPLEGLKILDLTNAYSGPIAAMQFADYGADVIKIERPGKGDLSRSWGPFVKGESFAYIPVNRSKRGLTLDLKKEEGIDVFLDLVRGADVVLENFRPGTMEKLGLSYEKLAEINPRIIVASLSGYGQTGPYANRAAYSNLAEAMAGTMFSTGFPEMPTGTGVAFGDSVGGMFAALGIMFALYNREKTGEGQYIDVAMTDSLLSLCEGALTIADVLQEDPVRNGNRSDAGYPYDSFEAKDGYCFLSVADATNFLPFAKAIGMEELASDERFLDNESRIKNADALFEYINGWTKQRTRAEIEEAITAEKQAYSPILSYMDILENEHFLARDMIVEMKDEQLGSYRMPGLPIKMSKTPGEIKRPSPELGEHTEEILKELGYDEVKIDQLKVDGVV